MVRLAKEKDLGRINELRKTSKRYTCRRAPGYI